jgi:hypothetical protein
MHAEFAKHIEKITMETSGERYVASGTWHLVGRGSIDGAGGAAQTECYFPFKIRVAA